MRVAALYDIHGNIDALDAVLKLVDSEGVDLIVIGGDIAWGPHPAETVARVQDLAESAHVIRGNADRELVQPESVEPGWIADVNEWCHEQLTIPQRQFLSDLPETVVISVGRLGEVLFCHATPRNDEQIFTELTPENDVAAMFNGASQDLVVCGHTHTQFDRRIGRHRVVNAGSVGMPYEDRAGAYWAIIEDEVELKRIDYDFLATAERMRKSDCPHAEGFAEGVTSPLRREEAVRKFEASRHLA